MEELAGRISDSELEIMRILWDAEEPLPVSVLREMLAQRKGWEATTVKTLVQRLCSKGCIAQEKRKTFYYSPIVTRQEYESWATGNLIRKLGGARNLMAALVQSDSLTQADVDELRSFFREGFE